jgi:hypothetical protein
MKSAVHLHRLPALSHLSLRVAEPDMDPAQSLAEQLHVMIGKQLAAAVWGELTRRAALMQQQKEQQQQQQEQQEQEAWHEDGSGCAGSSTTAGVPVAGPKDSPNNPPMQQLTKLTLVWPALPPTQSEVFYKNTGWNAAAEALGGALTCLEMEGPVCASAQVGKGWYGVFVGVCTVHRKLDHGTWLFGMLVSCLQRYRIGCQAECCGPCDCCICVHGVTPTACMTSQVQLRCNGPWTSRCACVITP